MSPGAPVDQLLVGDGFRQAARAVPDRVAAALGDESMTFLELDRRANAMARALHESGLRRGDRLLVVSRTRLDLPPVFAAAAKLGVVFAPASPHLSDVELLDIATAADAALLLADTSSAARAERVAAELGVTASTIDGLAQRAGSHPDDDIRVTLDERDPHVVFFTSGSTGVPKGAVLSQRANVLRAHPGAQFEPRGVAVCAFPLFHMAGWTIALQQWQARDAVVFVESASAATLCQAVTRHRATRLNCIPAVWRRILDELDGDDAQDHDLSSLRFVDTGTSATPPELLAELQRRFPHASVRVFYGSTEAGNVANLEHADIARKPGRVGVPGLGTDVRIDDGGELWVTNPFLFDGYLGDADATAEALADGWYRTGDLAELDEDGFLTIVGRARDVIRTGGETVAPKEVEAALADHPGVADVAVIGVPDDQWGEMVTAVVVLIDAVPPPTLGDLRTHCANRLAPPKQPRSMVVVDEIPRTASTGQVQRRLLAELIQAS